MGGRDRSHPRRGSRLAAWLPVALVLAVLAAGVVAWRLDPAGPDPADEPAAVAPPPGLSLEAPPPPEPVAAAATGVPDAAKVRRALAPALRDADLGPHVLATVAGLDGTLLYSSGTGEAVPASTLKLLTAAAALEVLGPDHTFATTVVEAGPRRVVLVGGGDPLLSAPDLRRLARDTAAALLATGRTAVRVGYDAGLFTGPEVSPHWPAGYIADAVVSPITSLWLDEGRTAEGYGRVADPAATAAATFAAALAAAGVTVTGGPQEATAPAGSAELARAASDPVSALVEHTLETSDNEAAEVLARHVGLAVDGDASFAGGTRAVRQVLEGLGVPMQGATTYDGSGLSRDNRLDPDTLTAVLGLAASPDQPDLRTVLTGLPVAGFSGSLGGRFEDAGDAGRGLVRAKTGTLSGVSGLAGIVTDRQGRPMVFALLADDIELVDTLDARDALDAATSALAGCRCG
ncbi:MAG TPA: D-alanyl-D-alanine carboxypeptidase/D-alanyl-D-alanine-endopeptidase [Nocardioides sp.]|nr:D-alanyl-D-alanine carboxypeptidase/D-alanyl-D-alanine-endopeptidase [Nocardioides sp.]